MNALVEPVLRWLTVMATGGKGIEAAILSFQGGSLQIFGNWFGQPYDNWHRPKSAVQGNGKLIETFDEGETLTIDEPEGIFASKTKFKVQRAERVKWEWYYYGRPKTPENRFFLEYIFRDSEVVATTNANWFDPSFNVSPHKPAVLMR